MTQRGKDTPKDIVRHIRILVRSGYTTAEIEKNLEAMFPGRSIALRTIQNYVKLIRDNGVPWDRTNMDRDDIRSVLDVLAQVIRVTNQRKRTFSDDDAEWVAWVARAAPGLSLYRIWALASLYLAEERSKNPDMAQLDAYVAFRPWDNKENEDAYFKAVPPEERITFAIDAAGSMTVEADIKATAQVTANKGNNSVRGSDCGNSTLVE